MIEVKSASPYVPLPELAPDTVMVKPVTQDGIDPPVFGWAGALGTSIVMTPVAEAELPKEAPLHVRLKSAASSCVAVAAARRRDVLSSFMYSFGYME
jgi:hypothetical protein